MRPTTILAALIAFGCLHAGTLRAGSLEILPVIVVLTPGQTTATIEVKNRGDNPAAIQTRPYSWAQRGDEDTLTPTQEIILSPPIFTVPAGASQTVRLLLRGGAEAAGDRSYRLLLDEVPAANIRNRQIDIALRVSMPVMVSMGSPAPELLQWRAERSPDGQTELTAVNPGKAYDRVNAIAVTLADGSQPKVIANGGNSYVLPGAQRHWIVQARGGAPRGELRLSVTTQGGKSEHILSAP
jgi:fimbrial chaperone protein